MTNLNVAPILKGRECKHACYFEARDGSPNDLLVIKEYEYYADGTRAAKLRLKHNHQRKFWITRESYRKHRDKKEWEKIDRLQEFKSTQINLVRSIARALGRAPSSGSLRMIARSPYVYGCDVTTPVLAKRHYMEKWPDCFSDNIVAVTDSETDMVDGHEEIIMQSITMKTKAKLFIVKDFMRNIDDPSSKIYQALDKYLGPIVEERGIKVEIEYVDNAGACAARVIETAHEWQPDILAIWNMNFDLPKMLKAMEKYGYDPNEVFSDPSIPYPFRQFRYIQGQAQKVTASGKTMALHPAEQWHIAECPASFYILDAMCVYLKLRIAKGKEPSYSLDAILQKHLGIRKLKFTAADHLSHGRWHTFMQKEHKPEYCVYNLFDCISMEMLDEKTTDLSRMISIMCAHSEYHRFPSQPRRTCDDLHFFALERGLVCATTSDKMEDDNDQHVVGLEDWIVTLPSHLVFDDGVKAIQELPELSTLFYAHVADLDVEGTYPNEEVLMNISKETTSRELCKIQGIDESVRRQVGINLSGGHVNAVEICINMYGAPTMDTLLAMFREEHMPKSRARPEMMHALQAEQRSEVGNIDDMREELNPHAFTDVVVSEQVMTDLANIALAVEADLEMM